MMPPIEQYKELERSSLLNYSDIIDVRSPAEFAEDHIPGAINLPVLNNEERAQVGTIYVKISRFCARRRGAALASANISRHLQTVLADKPASYHPLIYCWRGGLRSNAMATVLSAVGWRVAVLDGGYKTWRRKVVFDLRTDPSPIKIVLLDGQTGTAKTRILAALGEYGCQTLDLEGLANHRGSVFGGHESHTQPSQKFFESILWWALSALDLRRHIIVEAESKLVGKRLIPDRLAAAMRYAPRIEVQAELKARARYLLHTYQDITANPCRLKDSIQALSQFHTRITIERWLMLANESKFEQLAAEIAVQHYDPLYNKQRHRQPIATVRPHALNQNGIVSTAQKVADLVATLDV